MGSAARPRHPGTGTLGPHAVEERQGIRVRVVSWRRRAAGDGVGILVEPCDGSFSRTFVMADPDGYRINVYERLAALLVTPAR